MGEWERGGEQTDGRVVRPRFAETSASRPDAVLPRRRLPHHPRPPREGRRPVLEEGSRVQKSVESEKEGGVGGGEERGAERVGEMVGIEPGEGRPQPGLEPVWADDFDAWLDDGFSSEQEAAVETARSAQGVPVCEEDSAEAESVYWSSSLSSPASTTSSVLTSSSTDDREDREDREVITLLFYMQ